MAGPGRGEDPLSSPASSCRAGHAGAGPAGMRVRVRAERLSVGLAASCPRVFSSRVTGPARLGFCRALIAVQLEHRAVKVHGPLCG